MQPFASVAVAVELNAPTTVGVPERTPAGESDRPAGSAPAVTDHATAPTAPVWVSVAGT